MTNSALEHDKVDERQEGTWSSGKRLLTTLPIFVVLLGLLVSISGASSVPWRQEPTDQSIQTLTRNTAVTFANPAGVPVGKYGDYEVTSRHITIDAKRPSTGEVQHIRVNVREPKGAQGPLPGLVFMHGAGYGTCDNSFADVAQDFSSAGFVTAVLDKPVWSTNDLNRDYPGSAVAYDQVVDYLRGLPQVNADKIGLYATSESTWISPYVLKRDKRIAFQLLLSPMVYMPRHSLGFFVAQDFSLVGANSGYQSIVRRLFHIDAKMFGNGNLDVPVDLKGAYSVPTMVMYGSKDVMTAQVEGARHIFQSAHASGNTDVTVRSYPVANHVLRLGDEADDGTPLADDYVKDVTDWAAGTAAGLKQTSERVAGTTIHQSIAVPTELKANRPLTVYGTVVHVAMAVLLVMALVIALAALALKCFRLIRRNRRPVFGFRHGFGSELLAITITTLATFVLFGAGLGQVIMAVVKLGWGGAPDEDPGMMHWSWPVIQLVCTLVVWAWARVFARLIEIARTRKVHGASWLSGAAGRVRRVSGASATVDGDAVAEAQTSARHEPMLATTKFGLVCFWITAAAMLVVLLVFAFWGLFIY